MPEQIVCANCGIRFSADLAECPWCGTAPRTLATAAPPGPGATPSPPDGAPDGASIQPPPPPRPTPGEHAPTPPPAAVQPAPAAATPLPPVPPPPADAIAAGRASPTGLPPSDEPVVAVAAPLAGPPPEPPPPAVPPHPVPGAPNAPAPPAGSGAAPPPRSGRGRILGYAVAILVLLIIGALLAEFAPLGPRQRSLADTVTPVDPLGTDQTLVIETTDPPPTTTVTTQPPATTEGTATTTTTPPPTSAIALQPIGDGIPEENLRMGVDGLRDALLIGSDGSTAVGRLVATFGQPDADTGTVVSGGEFGTCSGDTVRVVRFGSLAIINTVDGGGAQTFAAYRVDLDYQETPSEADDLLTISRLKAGDTVADLQAIYSSLDVRLVDGPDGSGFELRNGGGELLLHGRTTGVDRADEIRGIYSPDACR